jgi:nicotinate-nucleotide adenylyltransferase
VRIALFGGTFNPVHVGHLVAARAAQEAFNLDEVHFIPASIPPHKRDRVMPAFQHRYTMAALACANEHRFIPSLLEAVGAGTQEQSMEPNYSIRTIRKVQQSLSEQNHLHFLIGGDAFLDVAHWHEAVTVLDSCDFIVVSRPGFDIGRIDSILPAEVKTGTSTKQYIQLRNSRVHLLTTLKTDVSSSVIRERASRGISLEGLVPPTVEEYIQKKGLYRNDDLTQ